VSHTGSSTVPTHPPGRCSLSAHQAAWLELVAASAALGGQGHADDAQRPAASPERLSSLAASAPQLGLDLPGEVLGELVGRGRDVLSGGPPPPAAGGAGTGHPTAAAEGSAEAGLPDSLAVSAATPGQDLPALEALLQTHAFEVSGWVGWLQAGHQVVLLHERRLGVDEALPVFVLSCVVTLVTHDGPVHAPFGNRVIIPPHCRFRTCFSVHVAPWY
jgi:hypothetical protein